MSAPSISQYIVLQIADTRFGIRSDYDVFTKWLGERCCGFVSQGEPHLRLDLRIDSVPQGQSSGHFMSIAVTGNSDKFGELKLRVACSDPAFFFLLILQICLRCAILTKQPPDLLLHSSGIVHGEMAYLFCGASGAGKSTVCKLLVQEPSFTILHDETVAIAQTEEGFHAWSTPLRGEMPAEYSSGAPLRAVFFLKHDQTNYTARLSSRKAAVLLTPNLMPPIAAANGGLVIDPAESLRLMLTLAERIPCYELHFRPDRSFWECIQQLFEVESTTTARKGKRLWPIAM